MVNKQIIEKNYTNLVLNHTVFSKSGEAKNFCSDTVKNI